MIISLDCAKKEKDPGHELDGPSSAVTFGFLSMRF